jgi:putative transposase
MVERLGKDLSVRRQCVLLSLTRSGVYRSKPVAGADDLAVIRRIDELHLELPFYSHHRRRSKSSRRSPSTARRPATDTTKGKPGPSTAHKGPRALTVSHC